MVMSLFSAPGLKKQRSSRQVSTELNHEESPEEDFSCNREKTTTSEPPLEFMENILQSRDEKIMSQQKALSEKDNEISMLKRCLGELCLQQSEDSYRHKLQVSELQRQRKVMVTRLSAMARDLHDTEVLHQYAVLVREAAPSEIDSSNESSYVQRVQSQLCKALHQVGVWGNQLSMLKSSCDEVVKSLQEDVLEMDREMTKAELKHRNILREKEREKNDMQDEYESMLKIQQDSIAKLEAELETLRSCNR